MQYTASLLLHFQGGDVENWHHYNHIVILVHTANRTGRRP